MAIYLTHETALQYWRFHTAPSKKRCRAALPFGRIEEKAATKPTEEEIAALESMAFAPLAAPFHLTVHDGASRTHDARIVFHVCTAELPRGSFIPIAPGVFVASPELCYLQLSTSLPFAAYLQLGFELCGCYRLRWGMQGRAVNALPLTSARSLQALAEKMPSVKGAKSSRRALRYLCDNSKSPMETDVTILLHMPIRMGGYGLEKPLLNHRIDVPKSMRRVLPQSHFAIDLYWPESAIGLEYDSRENHHGIPAATHDAIRVNGIEELGIRVVSMTTRQALSPVEFDRIALILAKQTGKRPCAASTDVLRKRAVLRSALFERFKQRPRQNERGFFPEGTRSTDAA